MTARLRLPVALALGALALLFASATAATAPAQAAKACPAKANTLAKDTFGRVWHTKATLYGCTTVYGRAPRTKRLGPWKPGTKVAWDGSQAVFSVPLTRDGHIVGDRLYAAD